MKTEPDEEIDEDAIRSADSTELKQLWDEWMTRLGPEETSRRWLRIFSATDAPKTG
jgi:hypothetical protein